jgi:hypothetical protein
MGKSRMMGAGNAGSTLYGSNVNLKTCGGNKKQGLSSLVGLDNWANRSVQINSNGQNKSREYVFSMNQLGGVSSSPFGSSAHSYAVGDGIHYKPPFVCDPYNKNPLTLTISILGMNIFSYFIDNSLSRNMSLASVNPNSLVRLYTNTSLLYTFNANRFKVNNIPLLTYLENNNLQNANSVVDNLKSRLLTALRQEDQTNGNSSILQRDFDNKLYSGSSTSGFFLGDSIASKLFAWLTKNRPDSIIAGSKQRLLQPTDEFAIDVTFTNNGAVPTNFFIRPITSSASSSNDLITQPSYSSETDLITWQYDADPTSITEILLTLDNIYDYPDSVSYVWGNDGFYNDGINFTIDLSIYALSTTPPGAAPSGNYYINTLIGGAPYFTSDMFVVNRPSSSNPFITQPSYNSETDSITWQMQNTDKNIGLFNITQLLNDYIADKDGFSYDGNNYTLDLALYDPTYSVIVNGDNYIIVTYTPEDDELLSAYFPINRPG